MTTKAEARNLTMFTDSLQHIAQCFS